MQKAKSLHKNVKYEAEVQMNLMNGLRSLSEKFAQGKTM
jgi:hypothetical protein